MFDDHLWFEKQRWTPCSRCADRSCIHFHFWPDGWFPHRLYHNPSFLQRSRFSFWKAFSIHFSHFHWERPLLLAWNEKEAPILQFYLKADFIASHSLGVKKFFQEGSFGTLLVEKEYWLPFDWMSQQTQQQSIFLPFSLS